ncbi:uncharacterized protein V6R79_013729 [Siganus canaliculatus]
MHITSPPRKRPQRIATQQEEKTFLPVNPVWFSGQVLNAMETCRRLREVTSPRSPSPVNKITKTMTLSPDRQATTITDADCHDPSLDKDNTRSHSHRVELIRASHSQSDKRYKVFSHNHQCTCNDVSLTFLAYQVEGCQFTDATLDRVLAQGDSFYFRLKQQLIHNKKFRSHHLAVEEMPKQVLTDTHLYSVIMSDVRCGYLKTTPSSRGRRQRSLPLATQLESLSKDVSLALILIAPECIAVFRDQSGREGQSEHPQESTVNDDHDDVSETEVPVFQSDSGTALSDKTAENLDPLSLADRDLLLQAVSDGNDFRGGMLHVFAMNKQVDDHNAATVSSLLENEIKIMAEDYRKDVATANEPENEKEDFGFKKGHFY